MNLLNIEHISKIYGEKIIFDDASFGVQEGDKIGIVGINGTGKTTLLRMIAGTEVPDDGQIIRQNGMKIAHLTQNPVFPEGATILSYVQSVAEDMEWRVQSNLNTLGITDHTMKIEHLSGGQKRRVAMAKVLAEDFDLLLLDEPTNHLDGEMISWLEGYLRAYRGTVIMVTHDRYFLDQVTNRILEISHGKMYSYDANYTTFLELKAQREEMELASERKRQSILRMELEWAKRGCRARTTKQKARLERLESLKNGSAPVTDDTITLDSVETRMGKKTMELHHVSKSYGEKVLVRDFSYTVLKNQKLGTGCQSPNRSGSCRKDPNRYSKSGRQGSERSSLATNGIRRIPWKIWSFCSQGLPLRECRNQEGRDRKGFGNQKECQECRNHPEAMHFPRSVRCRVHPDRGELAGQEAGILGISGRESLDPR